jgi:outer membrane scaffolding protein for murein synthesis (MipA/OmpV family)
MKRLNAAAGTLLLLFASALPARAETLSVRPSIDVGERYDSNVGNALRGHESEDRVTRITPKLGVTILGWSTRMTLTGGFDAEYFAEHSELDRSGMTKNVDLSAPTPMQLTPRLTLRPSARYVESRDAVRRNQLTQSDVPGLAPAETLVTARTGTRHYSGSLHVGYALTENLDVSLGAGATRNSYFDGGPSLVGSNSYTASGEFGYRLSSNFKGGLHAAADYDEFDNRNDVRKFSLSLSGGYRITPASSVEARVGATRIRSDETGTTLDRPSGRLEWRYAGRELSSSLAASIDYSAGAFGNENKRENVVLKLADRFSENWSGDTAATWQANRSLVAPFPEDLMSVQWTAGMRYSITRYARLRLGGEIFRQWNRGRTGSDLFRESATLGIDIGSDIPIL